MIEFISFFIVIAKVSKNAPCILFQHAERKQNEKPREKIKIPVVSVRQFNKEKSKTVFKPSESVTLNSNQGIKF